MRWDFITQQIVVGLGWVWVVRVAARELRELLRENEKKQGSEAAARRP